ncbi:alpha/beta hydrolase family protein [Planctomycetota bacterium]
MRCLAWFLLLCLIFPVSVLSQTFAGKCGDGVCDDIERSSGLCPEDCNGYKKIYTHVSCAEVGNIAVRIDMPEKLRYGDKAPIVVVASTWFVEKYNRDETPFHLVYNPVDVGAVTVSHLWPGKTDPESGIRSDGVYDFGGPDSLVALRDAIRFALGHIPDINGTYLHELTTVQLLYNNVGLFASSHAGVVATNVMAYYGEALTGLQYFVGRENPTMAEMYPLEIGHFDEKHHPIYNPYYDHQGYSLTNIAVDYTYLDWIQNNQYPKGRPVFKVPDGQDYVLDNKGPNINGKRWFSHALTQVLWDNGGFTIATWPADLATPAQTADFWPYRITVHNYQAIGEKLPELRVLLPFATYDHVQTAPDKPHIRQAYDGFHKTAGLWTRLNCDLAYVQSEIHASASLADGFPDNHANTEPNNWYAQAESWGFAEKLAGEMTAQTVPLAGIAEMADRVLTNIWSANIETTLVHLPTGAPLRTNYETVIEPFEVLGPSGNRIYGQIRRPDPSAHPDLCLPAVILVPGGINPGRMEVLGRDARLLAEAGIVVVAFNAEGRVDERAPEDLRSEGEEDYNGFRQQDGLARIIEYILALDYVKADNVGLKSQSYGITMAAGCMARHPELPVKYLVDGEGPPYSFATCHGPRYLAGDMQKYNTVKNLFGRLATWQDASPENLAWWSEREAINFIGAFRGYYLRLQATWDHAQPPESAEQIPVYHHPEGWPGGGPAWWHNKHTTDIVNIAVSGGVPCVRVNLPEQGNTINRTYDVEHPPAYLPNMLGDHPWAVRAILEMINKTTN